MRLSSALTKFMAAEMTVWAIEAFADRTVDCQMGLAAGSTVEQGLAALQAKQFQPLMERMVHKSHFADLDRRCFGVNGKRCGLNQVLQDLDRIEFYRDLLIDPKMARQTKVNQQRRADHRAKQLLKTEQNKNLKS
jgi:uncharacterized protein